MDVSLIVPAGMDTHSFEPTASDLIRMGNADLLLYNGGENEQWVGQVIEAATDQKLLADEMVQHVKLLTEEHVEGMQEEKGEAHDHDEDEDEHEHHHHDHDHEHDHDHDEHEHHHHHHGEGECDDPECACHHHHHHADEVFTSWGAETPKQFTQADIDRILTALDSGEYGAILRAKGIVPAADGQWLHFDYVPQEHEVRYGAADYTGRLCVIGSQLKEDGLKTLFGL